jgi:hypothetical protein
MNSSETSQRIKTGLTSDDENEVEIKDSEEENKIEDDDDE